MKYIITLVISTLIFSSLNLRGQTTFNLPNGIHVFKDNDNSEIRNNNDFDGDGITDLAILCTDKDENKIVIVYLTSHYFVNENYFWFPWNYTFVDFKYSNNTLIINSNNDEFSDVTLILKYYLNLKNMKLIGYGDSERVRGANDEFVKINSKTINLNTGEYEVNGIKGKINIDLITLLNIEKYFDYLNSVGSSYYKGR